MYQRKDSRYYRLIQSGRWQELRQRKLNANPLCEICASSGLYVSATEVHHIRPCETALSESEMEGLMFDYSNLQSLCHDCHVSEHRNMHSHSAAAEKERQSARTSRFIERFLDASETKREGAAFFIQAPNPTNPLPKIREKFLGVENSVGGSSSSNSKN